MVEGDIHTPDGAGGPYELATPHSGRLWEPRRRVLHAGLFGGQDLVGLPPNAHIAGVATARPGLLLGVKEGLSKTTTRSLRVEPHNESEEARVPRALELG